VRILKNTYDSTETCQKGFSYVYLFSFATVRKKKLEVLGDICK